MPEDTSTGIPKFYAQSRQILIAATISDTSKTDTAWIPAEVLKQHPTSKGFFTIHPPVRGLGARNFHAFDNGIEQSINYFKEADFPGANLTNEWYLEPDRRGTWGFLSVAGVSLDHPTATYLIGYAPPALKPGECRTIRVVVEGYDVRLNRERYCADKTADTVDESLRSTKLGTQMRNIAGSRKKGSINVSVQAFTFWSSGVLSLIRQILKGQTYPPSR